MSSGPGITVPPPVIYLIALSMAIGLQRLWPTTPFPVPWHYAAGAVLPLLALPIMPPVLTRFRRAGRRFLMFVSVLRR